MIEKFHPKKSSDNARTVEYAECNFVRNGVKTPIEYLKKVTKVAYDDALVLDFLGMRSTTSLP